MTKKMVSFRIDTELLDRLNRLKESKTDVIHKALEMYLHSSENVNTKRNTTVNTVNHVNQKVNLSQQENHNQKVNLDDKKVNPQIQVIENYELMEYLKRDHEWLKDRIEHFEHTQDVILAKLDVKQVDKDKPLMSWVRM